MCGVFYCKGWVTSEFRWTYLFNGQFIIIRPEIVYSFKWAHSVITDYFLPSSWNWSCGDVVKLFWCLSCISHNHKQWYGTWLAPLLRVYFSKELVWTPPCRRQIWCLFEGDFNREKPGTDRLATFDWCQWDWKETCCTDVWYIRWEFSMWLFLQTLRLQTDMLAKFQ